MTRHLNEKEGALDKHEDTLDVELPRYGIQDADEGGKDAEDCIDEGPEHGDVGQKIVQLVRLVERMRQLLDLITRLL